MLSKLFGGAVEGRGVNQGYGLHRRVRRSWGGGKGGVLQLLAEEGRNAASKVGKKQPEKKSESKQTFCLFAADVKREGQGNRKGPPKKTEGRTGPREIRDKSFKLSPPMLAGTGPKGGGKSLWS